MMRPAGVPASGCMRDVLLFGGAGLVCPVLGDIGLMPSCGFAPLVPGDDVDVDTGRVTQSFTGVCPATQTPAERYALPGFVVHSIFGLSRASYPESGR